MDYKNKYLKYKKKYNLLKQLGGVPIERSIVTDFVSRINDVTHQILSISVLSKDNKLVILLGEHHYNMDKFFKETNTPAKSITDIILGFLEQNSVELLLEAPKAENADSELWAGFIVKNSMQLEMPSGMIVDESIIGSLATSSSEFILKIDPRNELLGLESDAIFLGNFTNGILNLIEFFGDNSENNFSLRSMILSQIDTIIISKLVVYLLKKKDYYTRNPIVEELYNNLLESIKRQRREFMDQLNLFARQRETIGRTRFVPMPPEIEEIVERIIYGLVAQILDFNIIEHILNSEKETFIVYAGGGHTEFVRQELVKKGFTLTQ